VVEIYQNYAVLILSWFKFLRYASLIYQHHKFGGGIVLTSVVCLSVYVSRIIKKVMGGFSRNFGNSKHKTRVD